MCDLWGLSSNKPVRATKSLPLFAEKYSSINPDGWGIAYYRNEKATIKKKPGLAKTSTEFFDIVDNARSNIIIAHLRYATQGHACEENCHPFMRHEFNKDWVFAHNGNISHITRHVQSLGRTDSEHAFHQLLDEIKSYTTEKTIGGIYPGLKSGIQNIFSTYGKDIHLNFLMSDGSLLYAFNHYPAKPMYFIRNEKDFGGTVVVSTKKVGSGEWSKIPSDKVLVISNGEILLLSDRLKV